MKSSLDIPQSTQLDSQTAVFTSKTRNGHRPKRRVSRSLTLSGDSLSIHLGSDREHTCIVQSSNVRRIRRGIFQKLGQKHLNWLAARCIRGMFGCFYTMFEPDLETRKTNFYFPCGSFTSFHMTSPGFSVSIYLEESALPAPRRPVQEKTVHFYISHQALLQPRHGPFAYDTRQREGKGVTPAKA